MIRNYPQFFNWHLEYGVKPKPDKVPFNPFTGQRIDPHNPSNWQTYDAAAATGHPIGFALTDLDPFFFLDLDNCFANGQWSHEAVQICQAFQGAAMEVSQSNTGLHIMGTCDKRQLADKRNKWAGWLEFYTTKRVVGFGSAWGWQGDFTRDFTPLLSQWVPKRETVADVMNQTVGPVANYTGPVDDGELIARAMNARGSMAQAFGTKATFRDLWTGDASMLSQYFPSPSRDAYDRSSADAALMSHLAFWTGKDAARMDRLFRQSALMRPKYNDRPDYRNATVNGAVAKCTRVYDVQRATDDAPEATPISSEMLSVAEQVQYFKGCVYVRDMHRVMIPSGDLLTPPQFKAFYGGKKFIIASDGASGALTSNAFEAFTENRAWQFPKVHSTCFRPLATPGALMDGKVNVYHPLTIESVDGDAGPFLDYLARILPVERDRQILLSYLAALKQHPGIKFQWAVVLQGVEGNGKTIIARIMEYAIGQRYTHTPSAEDLSNPFNSYLENKLLIAVEEIHLQGKRELLDTLKPLITNDRVEVQPKGVDKRMIDNFANWIMTTNHRDAIVKTGNDRRYAIFFTAQQTYDDIRKSGMSGDYFPKLYEWLKRDNLGFKIIARYLEKYQPLAEFNPAGGCHRAPDTSTTELAIRASLGRAEQEIFDSVESGRQGFKNGWISSIALKTLFKENNIRMTPNKVSEMLETIGYKSIGRASREVFAEQGRPTMYVMRHLWTAMLTQDDYEAAQGYFTASAGGVVQFPARNR